MHSLDRHWRLGAFALGLVFIGIVGPEAWYIWSVMGIYGVYGPGVLHYLDINPLDAIWFVFIGWFLIMVLLRARRRERLRARALSGDLAAMPHSRIVPDPARAPDVAAEPLVIPHVGRGPTTIITATTDGLTVSRRRHRDTVIPWGEAQLLEVWTFSMETTRQRGYTLYGRDAYIEWDMPEGKKKLAVQDENLRRELLDLIAARTGLTPRTLSPQLQAPSASAPPARRVSVSGTVTIAILISLPFALAVAALLLPLTNELLLNAYVALSLGVTGLILLGVATAAYIKLLAPLDASADGTLPPFQVAPPPDTTGTGIYGLWWGKPLSDRLIECGLGLLLAADALPALWSLNEFQTPPNAIAPSHPPQQYLAGALLLPAIIGAMLFVFGLLPDRHVVLADTQGLSMRSGKQIEALRWDDVDQVKAHVSRGRITRYRVIGEIDEDTIEWPVRRIREVPINTGQSLTAAELAALVVARSGKALRVMGD